MVIKKKFGNDQSSIYLIYTDLIFYILNKRFTIYSNNKIMQFLTLQ